jgi:hypothetical protein
MVELSESWRAVLDVLTDAPIAWQAPLQIGAALRMGVEATMNLLCELDVAGWIVVWDTPDGPVITLSALAAERLELHLVEVGLTETPRWARAGTPDPAPPRPWHVCMSSLAAKMGFMLDPAQGPGAAAERAESADEYARSLAASPTVLRRPEDLPRPTQLVGTDLSPWPGPEQLPAQHESCPACGSRKLRPQMYCLYCDRWGLDRLIPGAKTTSANTPRFRPALVLTPADQRALDQQKKARERARRKWKRRRRQENRLEAPRNEKDTQALSLETGATTPPGLLVPPAPSLAHPPTASRNSASAAR